LPNFETLTFYVMNFIKLGNNHTFSVEFYGKKIRLVVYEDDVEKVCRKSTIKSLKDFIQSDENHRFKGRLQLSKTGGKTVVLVKGISIGNFGDEDWEKLISC